MKYVGKILIRGRRNRRHVVYKGKITKQWNNGWSGVLRRVKAQSILKVTKDKNHMRFAKRKFNTPSPHIVLNGWSISKRDQFYDSYHETKR